MPDLEQRIIDVLLGLRMVSEGTTGRWPDSLTEGEKTKATSLPARRQHGESRPPAGGDSLYDYWHDRIERAKARSSFALLYTVLQAEEALTVAHKAPKHLGADNLPELSIHKTRRMLNDHVGQHPMEVAAKFRCTASHVRTARIRDKRDPETGESRDGDERVARTLELAAAGLTVRQIAFAVGVPRSTVSDWLNRRRAA